MASRDRTALQRALFDPNAGKEKLKRRYEEMCSTATTIYSKADGINQLSKKDLERYSARKRNKKQPPIEEQEKALSTAPTSAETEAEPKTQEFQKPKTMIDFWIEQGWFETCKESDPKAIFVEKEKHTGYVRLKRGKWKDKKIRVAATKFLIEQVLRIEPRDIEREHFHSHMLVGLLNHYDNSPIKALNEAGYDVNEWELKRTPEGFFDSRENRKKAVAWLIEQLALDEGDPRKRVTGVKKDRRDLDTDDFHLNRQGGLLNNHFSGSPFKALKQTGLNFINGFEFYEWEMSITPTHFFDKKQNRIKAIKWLAEQLALPEGHPEKRVIGVKKHAKDITETDFNLNRLGGLLTEHYHNQPFEALYAAGLVNKKDEAYMRRKGAARRPSSKSA